MQEKEFKWNVKDETDLVGLLSRFQENLSGPKEIRVTDTYFDLPGLRLFSSGIGVRLRKNGAKESLQVKLEPRFHDSDFLERTEWEAGPLNGQAVDSVMRAFFIEKWGMEFEEAFAPVVKLEDSRTKWVLSYPGGSAELSLDRCRVFSPDAESSSGEWTELELEKLEGSDEAFLEAGRRFSAWPALEISSKNKLRRSLECLRLDHPGAGKPLFHGETALHEVLEGWLRYYLDRVRRLEIGVRIGADHEAVHDMRVGLRKMRSFLRMLPGALRSAEAAPNCRFFRKAANVLGEARNIEVYLEKIQRFIPRELAHSETAAMAEFEKQGKDELERARAKVCRMLASPAYRAGMERAERWVSAPILKAGHRTDSYLAASMSMKKTLRPLLCQVDKRAKDFLAHHDAWSDDRIHRLRIRFKRLRYGLEFYSQCLTPAALAVQEKLPGLQDVFGDYVDTLFMISRSECWAERLGETERAESLSLLLREICSLLGDEKDRLRQRLVHQTRQWMDSVEWRMWKGEIIPSEME